MPVKKKFKFTITKENGETTEHESEMFVATKEENLVSLNNYPFFIATGSYFATGEGQTYWLLASRAKSLDEFRGWVMGKVDAYFVSGFEFYINELPPKEDPALTVLASKFVLKLWADILDGEIESGHYTFYAEQHVNLS